VGAGVWLVRQPAPQPVPNIEAAWNEAISRLGIDPVYPPEEDLVVGDLLAGVISDDEPDPIETKDDKLKLHRDSPFLRRTVKIAHIDLRQALGTAYGMLTMFPASLGPPASLKDDLDKIGVPIPHRVFTKDFPQSELPQAAFPSLKIQGLNSTGFGASAGGYASGIFGASNQRNEELQLMDVRTYGLPSARALEALSAYCGDQKTANDCREDTARKHLAQFVGPRIYNQYVDQHGNNQYGMGVQIALVSRVYMTKKILHLRSVSSTRGGRFATESTREKQPAEQSSSSSATDGDVQNIRRRLDEVQAQLSKLSPGSVLLFESDSGSVMMMENSFDRPVTFGIRTVRYDFSNSNKNTQPTEAATK